MNSVDTANIFNSILEETHKYIPSSQLNSILGGYGLLVASITPDHGFDNPFIRQSLNTALHLSKLGFQSEYIACALLYYPYIKGNVSRDKLLEQFGTSIASIMDCLCLLASVFESYLPWVGASIRTTIPADNRPSGSKRKSRNERNLEPFAFLAVSQHLETAVLKIVERMFLLKDLRDFPVLSELNKRLAQDSLDIFAPVAEMLGMWQLKSQIEDLAFKVIEPEIYKAIALDLQERLPQRQARIERAIKLIGEILSSESVKAKLSGRPKHIYGLYKKSIQTGKPIAEINDTLAIRIIVDEIEDCYVVLNILENHFGLVEGVYEEGKRYRDWIITPKPNQYQSIHTTICFEDKLLEVQIRTQAMHDLAEYGAAAHWIYRKTGNSIRQQEKYKGYVEQISLIRQKYEQGRTDMG